MKLTLLGTGCATTTDYYNTAFTLQKDGQTFLVDTTGGIGILKQLKESQTSISSITDIFITHRHTDHILGMMWLYRVLERELQKSERTINIYGHDEVIHIIREMAKLLFTEKQVAVFDKYINYVIVQDSQVCNILGCPVTFFDIHSIKAKQFGFCMEYESGKKLVCCGDEPFNPLCGDYVNQADWLLHEAFCLYADRDIYHPYKISHSTVKDGCSLAEEKNVKNLILYHTEEKTFPNRKKLYTEEGKQYYHGNLFVPEDLESFEL